MDDFTRGYLEAALWTSGTNEDENTGEPMMDDAGYTPDDFAPHSLAEAVSDCEDFQEANENDLQAVSLKFDVEDERHGFDFWLTRNGHGAGFWDRGYGPTGDRLADAARVYGSVDLYIHKGQVHGG